MIKDQQHYDLYFKFIETYSNQGFDAINRNDPFILSLEEVLDMNKQFLLIFDMLNMKKEFTSLGSIKMLGIKPEELTSYHFKEATHPDDLKRHELGLVQLFKIAHDIFVEKTGYKIISTNFRLRNPTGNYGNYLIQGYFFYSPAPVATVYLLHLCTDISWCKKMKHGFHYYLGNDLSYFRYPDEALLMKGNIFSVREFQIIKLIKEGLDSEQIADKIFLSKHTVNKHRKNILDKTGHPHMSFLIYSLHEQGLL